MENITELNGAKYKYEYKLYNRDSELSIRDSAVEYLEILDNLFNPFTNGSVAISNSYNSIESTFLYRGDGTDMLDIILYPEQNDKKKIELSFVIVEELNYIDNASPIKNKKIYKFIDKDESLFKSKFPYGVKATGKGGVMIKDMLKLLKLEADTENFEDGDFEINSLPEGIFPTLSYRYLDLLYYILQYNYITDGDISVKCIFKKENNKYQLTSLAEIFKKNKDLVYEVFHTGDLVDKPKINPNNPPPGPEYSEFINNTPSYSMVTPDKTVSNTYFMNSLVVCYNHILGDFETAEIRIKDIRDKWKKKFVDVFSAVGGKVKPCLLLNSDKKEKEFKVYRLPFNSLQSPSIVEAEIISNLIFFNQQLTLNVKGDTGRRAGFFIDLFKGKVDKNKADSKLLGRWLVTTVTHKKINNNYTNEISCVKTYVGPTFNQEDV